MPEQMPDRNPLQKSTTYARIGAGVSLVLLIIGWLALREEFYGSHQIGWTLVPMIFGPWVLGIFAGVFALNIAYGTGVAAEAKVVIVDMAVAGLVLNALSIALFLLLIYELGKIR